MSFAEQCGLIRNYNCLADKWVCPLNSVFVVLLYGMYTE